MAKVKIEDKIHPTSFLTMSKESAKLGEDNDCTVKAIAVLCNVTYNQAHKAAEKKGRVKGKGMDHRLMAEIISDYGYSIKKLDKKAIYDRFISRYPGVHKGHKNITTHQPKRFNEVWADEPPMALFTTQFKHVSAFKDGQIHDWAVGRCLRVEEVWIVEKDAKKAAQKPAKRPAKKAVKK